MRYNLIYNGHTEIHDSLKSLNNRVIDHLCEFEANTYRKYRKTVQYSAYIPNLIIAIRYVYIHDDNTFTTFSITLAEDHEHLEYTQKDLTPDVSHVII